MHSVAVTPILKNKMKIRKKLETETAA